MPSTETDGLLRKGRSAHQNGDDDQPLEDPDFPDEATTVFARMKAAVVDLSASTRIAGREAIQQEVSNVKDAWNDHLMEINDGEGDFFLTMSLTKNFSLLPSKPEIVQAEEEIVDAVMSLRRKFSAVAGMDTTSTAEMAPIVEDENPEAAPPLSAYLVLGLAVCALSSIGPFLAKQENVNPCLKIVWRFQGTAILLAPLAIRSGLVDGWPKLTPAQWINFVCASASYAVLCVAFAMSINYTTVSNATILTNSQSVLLVAAKVVAGHHVLFLEGFGVTVAFLGGILCARESAELEGAPAHGWWSVWGDVLGLISSIGGIGYIILGKSLRSSMPVLFFMVLNMATASFLILLYMWITRNNFTWNRDVNIGVFGWMNSEFDRFPLEMMTVFVVRRIYFVCVSFAPTMISRGGVIKCHAFISVQLFGDYGLCSCLQVFQQRHNRRSCIA